MSKATTIQTHAVTLASHMQNKGHLMLQKFSKIMSLIKKADLEIKDSQLQQNERCTNMYESQVMPCMNETRA